ncbi:MAG TPA: metallopeptidase TldD-related protein [Acidimicrobiales bacterium]|nr:metallopeptidase TldD-related protein [Acidimicrobiales bacterium]
MSATSATNASSGRLVPAAELAEAALAGAGAGAEVIVIVEESSEADVRFANNTTTTNGVRRDRRVSVVAFDPRSGAPGTAGRGGGAGGSGVTASGPAGTGRAAAAGADGAAAAGAGVAGGVATASVSRSGLVDIDELVAEARRAAGGLSPAEDASPLIGPSVGGYGDGTFEDDPAATDLGELAGLVGELAELFARARSEHRVLAGFAHHVVTTTYLASSTGLRLRHVQPSGTVELVARSEDGSASAWAGLASPDFAGVSLEPLERRLVERLGWTERRIELPAGRYETLLPPDAVSDLMIGLYEATGGRNAEDGASVFSGPGGTTRIGEQLTNLPFRLYSDPAAPGLESMPFLATAWSGADVSVFDNGMPIGATSWIEDGKLASLQYHRAGAARAGVAAAVPADNLLLDLPGSSASLEELIGRSERALLLTCMWYVREVDPATLLLTGLTRDGVYLVEHGEVVGAVNNFRWNESPIDVLRRTVEAGAIEPAFSREWNEWMPRVAMPALRVADFNMSTVSPAS